MYKCEMCGTQSIKRETCYTLYKKINKQIVSQKRTCGKCYNKEIVKIKGDEK